MRNKPVLYIDVDGTLLTEEEGKPQRLRELAKEFMAWALTRTSPVFLTCWEKHEIERDLAPMFGELAESMRAIPRAEFRVVKADAMDLASDWWRLDDHYEASEWEMFERADKVYRVIVVDPAGARGLATAWAELASRMRIEAGEFSEEKVWQVVSCRRWLLDVMGERSRLKAVRLKEVVQILRGIARAARRWVKDRQDRSEERCKGCSSCGRSRWPSCGSGVTAGAGPAVEVGP